MGSIKDFEETTKKNSRYDYDDATINEDDMQVGMGSIAVQSSINDSKQLLKRPELYPNNPYYEEFEEEFKLRQNIKKHHEKERKERLKRENKHETVGKK